MARQVQHNRQQVLKRSIPQERSVRARIAGLNGNIVKRFPTNLYVIALALGGRVVDRMQLRKFQNPHGAIRIAPNAGTDTARLPGRR